MTDEQRAIIERAMAEWLSDYLTAEFITRAVAQEPAFKALDKDALYALVDDALGSGWVVTVTKQTG